MKTFQEYLNESILSEGLIRYDEKKHITGVDFSKLSNIGDSNILNDIEEAGLGMLISPQEEEFGYQWMNIYWDKNIIDFYMPNNLSNGGPTAFTFKIKWTGDAPWKPENFSLYQVPGVFVKIAKNIDITKFKTQICTLMSMVMNREPEPLW